MENEEGGQRLRDEGRRSGVCTLYSRTGNLYEVVNEELAAYKGSCEINECPSGN